MEVCGVTVIVFETYYVMTIHISYQYPPCVFRTNTILLAIYFYDRKLVWLDGYPIGWLLFPFLEGGYER